MGTISGNFYRCRYKIVTAVASGSQLPQNVVSGEAVVNAASQAAAYNALVNDLGYSGSTTVSVVLEYGFEQLFPGLTVYD